MLEEKERVGWRFPTPASSEPPTTGSIEVIALLIEHSRVTQTDLVIAHGRFAAVIGPLANLGTMARGAFGWRLMSRRSKSSVAEQTPSMEAAMPRTAEEIKASDDLLEKDLIALFKDPDLAVLAFPDPKVRENIIPLFRDLKAKAEEAQQDRKHEM
jgi:hypothetical protein